MIKYLIVPLSSDVPPICRYELTSNKKERKEILPEILKKSVDFAQRNNMVIQYIWPEVTLSENIKSIIEESDHVNFKPIAIAGKNDVSIINLDDECDVNDMTLLSVMTLADFVLNVDKVSMWIEKCSRLNVILKYKGDNSIYDSYKGTLALLGDIIHKQYSKERNVQFNLLTDRIFLHKMRNCNAGVDSIMVGLDGNFYLCPACYYNKYKSVGNLWDGITILNQHLLKLENSPVCNTCDAFHCSRCIFENRKRTLEYNIPGNNQCVLTHIERNASAVLSQRLAKEGLINEKFAFKESECLDPFYKLPRIQLK